MKYNTADLFKNEHFAHKHAWSSLSNNDDVCDNFILFSLIWQSVCGFFVDVDDNNKWNIILNNKQKISHVYVSHNEI